MRYVPKLIPEQSAVLKDYFKGSLYKPVKRNKTVSFISWAAGLFFLLGALGSISHFPLFVLFGLLGLILIPPGHAFLEKKLRFRLTSRLKTAVCTVLFIASMPLANHYAALDQTATLQKNQQEAQTQQQATVAAQQEQQRADSFAFYLQQSSALKKEHQPAEATRLLEHAATLAGTQPERDRVEKERTGIAAIKAIDLAQAGKYAAALEITDSLLLFDPGNIELTYNRALCNSKAGYIQEAVNDLKPLIQAGNAAAEALHEKINPVRKTVSGYITLCWDGSTSYAKGRGACSHHGGVKNWNEPVYEESRKYE
jgi:tetratricopeptide (TPR) repeat protein